MLTRLLLLLGLVCLLLWLLGRASLMVSTPPPAALRVTIPGEELLTGLDLPEAMPGGASALATLAPSPLPSAPPTPRPDRAVTRTPLPLVTPTTGCFMYTVQAGDTPALLSQRFDTSVLTIVQDNQLPAAPRLRPGQRLALCPGPAASAAALPRYRVYRAQPGDTLPGVALRFGLPVYRLAQANNLPLSARLYSGQPLRLPDDALLPLGMTLVPVNPLESASAAPPSPSTATSASAPAPRRVPVPQATETVHLEWPRQVTLDQPAAIRLGFGRNAPLPAVGLLAGLGQPAATPLPVFRADRALLAAYDGVAVAKVAAAGVEPRLLTPDAQALTHADMAWTWSLSPGEVGHYPVQVSLETRWTPRDGGPPIVHTVWRQALDIEVVQPPMPVWLSNLLGVVGTVLSLLGLALDRRRPPTNPTPMQTTTRRF